MGIFATKARRTATDGPEAGRELRERVRRRLPDRFEAVGEALASGSGSPRACEVAGRALAQDGVSLDEILAGLRETSLAVTGEDPSFDDVRAMSIAWSEVTLAYLHQLSCEDPLTGLASLAHIRSRLTELYRGQLGAAGPDETHAIVVLDLPDGRPGSGVDSFDRAMRLVQVGEAARTVFSGTEPIGRSGPNRIVIIVERSHHLGRRVALVRSLAGMGARVPRAWIEGLPPTDDGAAMLLDELCRD